MKEALWLTEAGFSLIPLNSNPADPHYRKRPRDKAWRATNYRLEDLQASFRNNRAIGARVPAGIVVIDVDVKPGQFGMQSLQKILTEANMTVADLTQGSWVKTGSGGFHYYFALPEGIEKVGATVPELKGIDFRGLGFQVVAPGSINAAGGEYEWDEMTLAFEQVTIPPIAEVADGRLWKYLTSLRDFFGNAGKENDTSGVNTQFWSDAEVRRMLEGLDVTEFRDHEPWYKVMCACHEASNGLAMDVFYEWCVSDPDPTTHIGKGDLERRWLSFRVKEGGITRRYLETLNADRGRANVVAQMDFDTPNMRRMGAPTRIRFKGESDVAGEVDLTPRPSLPIATIERSVVETGDDEPDFPEGFDDPDTDILDPENLKGPLQFFNDEYAVVNLGGKVVVGSRKMNAFGNEVWEFMKIQDFRVWKADVKMEAVAGNTVKIVPATDEWLEWPGRRKYHSVDFYPGLVGGKGLNPKSHADGVLNLWTSWGVDPSLSNLSADELNRSVPPESCSQFHELVHNAFGSGNGEYTQYIYDWLCWSIANPARPAEVAIVFRGGKGIGKGSIAQVIGKIVGDSFWATADMDHVIGNFNGNLKSCSFLFLDEALWAGSKQAERKFKNILTEPIITTTDKGFQPLKTRNCLHVMMASNEDWVAPVSKDERRFAIFDVRPVYQRDSGFWRTFYRDYLGEYGGADVARRKLADLFAWMLARGKALTREGWRPATKVPQTEALAEQAEYSKTDLETWWDDVRGSGMLGPIDLATLTSSARDLGEEEVVIWSQWIRDAVLTADCVSRANRNGDSYSMVKRKIGKLVKDNWGAKASRPTVPKELRDEIEHSTVKQAYAYVVSVDALEKWLNP
ncbi:putative primase/polymerase [Achromobacter phage vB_AxyS_19-32_Axy16]|nr:putative primase/polymerase [Achromobacter phage vB_AxyS_19-32_Axy16]